MDGQWLARFATGWQPPLTPAATLMASASVAPQQTAPPVAAGPPPAPVPSAVVVPSKVVPPGSINQEPTMFHSHNSGNGKPGKARVNNSIMSIMSGSPNSSLHDDSQLLNSRFEMSVNRHPAYHGSKRVPDERHGVASPFATTKNCSGNPQMVVNETGGSPYIASQIHSCSTNQASVVHGIAPADDSLYRLNYQKFGRCELQQQNEPGNPAQSTRQRLYDDYPLIAPTQSTRQGGLHDPWRTEKPVEARPTTAVHSVPYNRLRLHVFCLKTAGEIFITDNGLLGVICLCHHWCMSVLEFCKHSGSSTWNPGVTVCLENGEPVAHWRRLLFLSAGIRVPADDSGWDWPDCIGSSVGRGCLVGSNASIDYSSKNHQNCQQNELSARQGRYPEYLVSLTSSNPIHTGYNPLEKLLRQIPEDASKDTTFASDCFLRSWNNSSSPYLFGSPPGSNSMLKVQENRGGGLVIPKNDMHTGNQISAFRLVPQKETTRKENEFNANCLSFMTSNHVLSNNKDNRPGELPSSAMDCSMSNFDLNLGQPSHKNHNSMISVFGCAISQPFEAPRHSVNPQYKQGCTPMKSNISGTVEEIETRCNSDNLTSERNALQHQPGKSGICCPSASQDFNGDIHKGSSISLFLSHLNTYGDSNISRDTDNFCITQKCTTKLSNSDTSPEFNCTDLSAKIISDAERSPDMRSCDVPLHVDEGNNANVSADRFITKTLFGKKDVSERKISVWHPSYHDQGLLISQVSNQAHNHPLRFPEGTDGKSNQPEKVSCNGEHENQSRIVGRSVLPIPSVDTGGIADMSPLIRNSNTKAASVYDQASPMLHSINSDVSRRITDENMRSLAVTQLIELSKQELSTYLDKTPQTMSKLAVYHGLQHPKCHSCCMFRIQAKRLGVSGCNNCICSPIQNTSLVPEAHCLHFKEHECHCPTCHNSFINIKEPMRFHMSSKNGCSSVCHECQKEKLPKNTVHATCRCLDFHKNVENELQGGFCWHAFQKCFAKCCLSRTESVLNAPEACPCKAKLLQSPNLGRDGSQRNGNLNGFDEPEGSRKQDVNDGCGSGMWRDVFNIGKHERKSSNDPIEQCEACNGNSATGIVSTCPEVGTFKEQQALNIFSGLGSFVPAIADIAVEANSKISSDSCPIQGSSTHDVVDEGSGIEKCKLYDEGLSHRSGNATLATIDHIDSVNESCSIPDESSEVPTLTNSLRSRKAENCHYSRGSISMTSNNDKPLQSIRMPIRRKRAKKWKKLDASNLNSGLSSVQYDALDSNEESEQYSPLSDKSGSLRHLTGIPKKSTYSITTSKHKRKRSVTESSSVGKSEEYDEVFEDSDQSTIFSDRNATIPHGKRKFFACWNVSDRKEKVKISAKSPLCMPVNYIEGLSCKKSSNVRERPVVCGDYGVISNKDQDVEQRTAKIVSLISVLKHAKKCTVPHVDEDGHKHVNSITKKTCTTGEQPGKTLISGKLTKETKSIPMHQTKNGRFSRKNNVILESSLAKPVRNCRTMNGSNSSVQLEQICSQLKSRRRMDTQPVLDDLCRKGIKSKLEFLETKRVKREDCFSGNNNNYRVNINAHSHKPSMLNLDAFCCVCGSSDKDDVNHLMECSSCLIRVHQACYGVLKVPKGQWYCRPCRTNFRNIVCVLCGYGGGAMTRAIKSQNIVKSMLKNWAVDSGCNPHNIASPFDNKQETDRSQCSIYRISDSVDMETDLQSSPTDLEITQSCDHGNDIRAPNRLSELYLTINSITAGVLDPSVTQWVHMVCGLWTPGTRCPNVDTMSTFDVSGALMQRKSIICSICNRAGGTCIKCRIVKCSAQFHPWCAHQKGLLQSEIEGLDNENVGFYGRCAFHANSLSYPIDIHSMNTGDTSGRKDFSCARIEGYKGWKREGIFINHVKNPLVGSMLSQEQIDAWVRVKAQKTTSRGMVKPSMHLQYDCQKEYLRYKQEKGWKRLVVYKSRIHALGLYTSCFILRGEMVVEYVGEIIGLRVADKREIEYQSGVRIQYKSACYFFRIDKDNIIDATGKGGIARFVNHSCLPNCVAKVISVRNDKKVVFFADRDIYPGEEITYNYHFNHEDEGKKIPCFCNSKNCRRYLN